MVQAQTSPTYSPGDYRTASAGTLSQTAGTASLEQFNNENTWVATSYPLPANATLYVQHAAQAEGTLEVNKVMIAPSQTFIIKPTAYLTTTTLLSIAPGATLMMQGDVHAKGTLQLDANAKLTINSSSYQGQSNLWAGVEEIDPTSEIKIEDAAPGMALFVPGRMSLQANGYALGNLSLALTKTNTQWVLTEASANLAAGQVSISLPSSSSLLFTGANSQVGFGQSVLLAGGTYYVQNQAGGTSSLVMAGGLQVGNSAVLQLNQTGSASALTQVDLKGNLTVDPTSSIINSATVASNTSGIRLTGTDWQIIQVAGAFHHASLTVKAGSKARLASNLTINPNNSVYAGTLTVENGAFLDFNADAAGNGFVVAGQGHFRSEQGSTLYITSAQGINASGASGNVQVTDTRRTFNQVATFVYSGTVPQQTGNAFTTTASGKVLIIDNPTSVTLTQSTGISNNTSISATGGRLEILQGKFITTPTADITSTGRLVMRGGVYQIQMLNTQVPLLTGTYDLTGGVIELAGNGNQTLKGGTYPALIISGSNTLGVNAKTISSTTTITQNLTILPNAILDASNKSLKGDGGLTMTGGTLRLGRVTTTLPELAGVNNPYNLTGGTIEFYGTLSGQYQSIKGTYGASKKITYHNLQLNAVQASGTDGESNITSSANFDVSGTLSVNAPTVFQVVSSRTIAGTGSFIVQPGATLLYGSPQGIKTSGTGTQDGNIRVSGTRTFSPEASYGFIGTSEMVTGNGLPATVANLLVAKTSNGITLTNSVAVTGTFTLKTGLFKTDTRELYVANASPSALVVSDPALYIQGNLRRAMATTGTYSFPVGSAAGKRTLDVTSNELAGNGFQSVLVSFQPLANHQDSDMFLEENDAYYTSMQADGVWQVDPNAMPATGTYTAVASLQGFSNLTDNQFALLVRPKSSVSGRDWTTGGGILEGENKEGRTVLGGYAKRSFMTQFGQMGIGNATMGVLPVTWLSVTGKRHRDSNVIEWATATEINNDRFEIEYSLDGKTFKQAGTIKGAGNSSMVQKYIFTHAYPSPRLTYYRIKQIDVDGAFELSKVITVKANNATQSGQLTAYPNPTSDVLQVAGLVPNSSSQIDIFTLTGQKIYSTSTNPDGTSSKIQVKHLPSGTYVLQLSQEGITQRLRFIKQ
ncbi:hypothetical protein GCM10023183_15260 [Nibribacter koreensis]|uniref:Secretion system C-terminal sorting domain-containing protein n=1 Tax=Nibribacter koreensis TaxID=1084519 RepID=A0ABP8FGB2_9BACT